MIPLSSLTVETAIPTGTTVLISRTDPTDSTKQVFDRLAVAALLSAASSTGGSVQTIELAALNLTIPSSIVKNTALGTQLYQITDVNDTSNLLLLGVEIVYQDVIGSKFTYDLWAGNPTVSGSQKLASAGEDIFFTAQNTTFSSSATAYLSNADLRSGGLWINVINRLTSPLKFSAKLTFAKFLPPISPVTLPPYTATPFVYGGASNLSVVDVGPGQTFPEMADAMPYVAPGFTMRVHAGQYFKPFFIPTGMDGFTITAAAGVTADDIVCNGRGGWVTGYPVWTENAPPGLGPVNPFRLARGKGFIVTNSPGTISKLGFWYCGGGLGSTAPGNQGDAEAGIYAEGFLSPGALNISRCTFDGNENGIFTPGVGAGSGFLGANVKLYIDHCDFSLQVPNGQTPDGLSHNVYASSAETHVTNSSFYGCRGNSFKSRSPVVTIDNSFMEADAGRCIDFPDGGSLTVGGTTLSQNFTGGNYPQHNYLGFGTENNSNGATAATFTNCPIHIGRYDTVIRLANSAAVSFTSCPYTWYTAPDSQGATFGYDTAQSTSGVTGITFPATSSSGGTIVASGIPPRPATPAHLS